MPDYAGLQAEIALLKYANMSDSQIATDLETPLTVTVDVPVGQVEGYLRSRMLMGPISRYVATPPTGAPGALVEGLGELLGMLQSPHVASVMMTDATVNTAVTQILAGAVAVGLMAAQNQTDLLAMASVSTTRAQQLGLMPDVHEIESEIAAARIWPGVSET